MSILSCNRFRSSKLQVDVLQKKNAVQLNFEYLPDNTTSVNVTPVGYYNNNEPMPLVDIAGNYIRQNLNQYIGTSPNQYIVLGYKFFFQNGYLKCVKKEISYYHSAQNNYNLAAINAYVVHRNLTRQIFCHPASVFDFIHDFQGRAIVQEAVVALAEKNGISVPEKFTKERSLVSGDFIIDDYSQFKGYHFAALDWLAYPLIREIDSPTVSRNMIHADRNAIAPEFEPKNFRQLVQHYYGTCTSKLLEELWKAVTTGGDTKITRFDPANVKEGKRIFFAINHKDVLQVYYDHAVQIGDRRFQYLIFTFGVAFFKTMGFDYFYQVIPHLSHKVSGEVYSSGHGGTSSTSVMEFDMHTMLKHMTPKKLVSIMFVREHQPAWGWLHDTAEMLRTYESPGSIPPKLREQYPNGLAVDFKFKTFKELHDKISTQYTIINTEASKKEIPISECYRKLYGRERDGLKLIVPTNTSTLAVWGKLLNICVASYGDRAVRGNTLLLGVEKEGSIKYCIEFNCFYVAEDGADKHTEIPGAIIGMQQSIIKKYENPDFPRDIYPKLLERHAGVLPADAPEEEGIYYIPSMVQFRGERNGDPVQEERIAVENMLIEWTKENFEFLSKLPGIFSSSEKGYSAGIDIGAIHNALNQAVMNQGRADQLLLAPEQHDNLMRAFNYQEQRVNVNVQVPHQIDFIVPQIVI